MLIKDFKKRIQNIDNHLYVEMAKRVPSGGRQMRRVKEFTGSHIHEIDYKINQFLEENTAELLDIKYQMVQDENGLLNSYALLIYEVADK